MLLSVSRLTSSPDLLRFQSALALQCFTNEYIYEHRDSETKALKVLGASIKKMLHNGEQPSPQSILCLASYKALYNYEWCDLLAPTNDIKEVFIRQVTEPKQESILKPGISALEEINDKVSSKVKEQYEESPYPRWVNLGLPLKPNSISELVDKVKLRLFDRKVIEIKAPNILIAACGTGQHAISTSARFKNAKVLAIDLSLSCLAYAK